jgi:putative sigma-54 modulation protein
MQIAVTFRHMEPDEGVRDYVKEKTQRLEKYIDHPGEAHVILSVEKFRHLAEITLVGNRAALNSQGRDRDLYAAIDLMVDKMERQMRERRGKIRKRRPGGLSTSKTALSESGELAEGKEEDDISSLIQRRRTLAKPMSLGEAVAQLRLSKKDFLIFVNSDSDQMNVLYRGKDGAIEWVEPRFR